MTAIKSHLLKPTPEEIRRTRVLFLARHALDRSEERMAKYGYHVVYHAVLLDTLRALGFPVTPAAELDVLFGPLDFDFLYAIHSHAIFEGHELLAPAIAAMRGIPCLGPPAPMRAVSEDKALAKHVAASLGIKVASHKVIDPKFARENGVRLGGAWIVKPRGGIASDAILKVNAREDWPGVIEAISDPRHEDRLFIAEQFVPGMNLTVPVIEGFPAKTFRVFEEKASGPDNLLTQAGKRGLSSDYDVAAYDGPGADEALDAAARFAAAIGPHDYGRIDFRYDPERRILVFIEPNFACNMSPASIMNRAVAQKGIAYEELVAHVITHSLRRQKRR